MLLLFAAGMLVGSGLMLVLVAPQPAAVVTATPVVRTQPRSQPPPRLSSPPERPLEAGRARRPRQTRVAIKLPREPAPPPVRLRIPRMHVDERLVGLRVQADGTLASPADFDDPGWYRDGVAPGDRGPAVIVGHVDSFDGPAVFFKLETLRPGDQARVRRADGTTVIFVVDRVERFAKDSFPTEQVYGATKGPELRLITCGGGFNETTRHYDDNVVAFASLADTDDPDGHGGQRARVRRSDRRPPGAGRRG